MSNLPAVYQLEVSQRSLEELAAQARDGHVEVKRALEQSLRYAIIAGRALCEARQRIDQGFIAWVEGDCGLSATTAQYYMRIAFYESILPSGLNLKEAISYLRGLPATDGRSFAPYPEGVIREAQRLRQMDRLSYNKIADRLGTNPATVRYWCRGPQGKKAVARRKARQRELLRAERREQSRREAERAARKRGGSIANAYSHLRKLAQELDAAIAQEDASVAKAELKACLSKIYGAEVHLCRAVGVDYGKDPDPRL